MLQLTSTKHRKGQIHNNIKSRRETQEYFQCPTPCFKQKFPEKQVYGQEWEIDGYVLGLQTVKGNFGSPIGLPPQLFSYAQKDSGMKLCVRYNK